MAAICLGGYAALPLGLTAEQCAPEDLADAVFWVGREGVDTALALARELLDGQEGAIDALARALVARSRLDRAEIAAILDREVIERPPAAV